MSRAFAALPEEMREHALRRALDQERHAGDQVACVYAVSRLQGGLRDEQLERLLEDAAGVEDPLARQLILESLVEVVPERLFSRALELSAGLPNATSAATVLRRLIPRMVKAGWDPVWAVQTSMTRLLDPESTCRSLIGIARELPNKSASVCLAQAAELCANVGNPATKVNLMAEIVSVDSDYAERLRDAALGWADHLLAEFGRGAAIEGLGRATWILERYAPFAPEMDLKRVTDLADKITESNHKDRVRVAVIKRLVALDRLETARAVHAAMSEAFLAASALLEIASAHSGAEREAVLEEARRDAANIDDVLDRVRVLVRIGERSSNAVLVARAFKSAWDAIQSYRRPEKIGVNDRDRSDVEREMSSLAAGLRRTSWEAGQHVWSGTLRRLSLLARAEAIKPLPNLSAMLAGSDRERSQLATEAVLKVSRWWP